MASAKSAKESGSIDTSSMDEILASIKEIIAAEQDADDEVERPQVEAQPAGVEPSSSVQVEDAAPSEDTTSSEPPQNSEVSVEQEILEDSYFQAENHAAENPEDQSPEYVKPVGESPEDEDQDGGSTFGYDDEPFNESEAGLENSDEPVTAEEEHHTPLSPEFLEGGEDIEQDIEDDVLELTEVVAVDPTRDEDAEGIKNSVGEEEESCQDVDMVHNADEVQGEHQSDGASQQTDQEDTSNMMQDDVISNIKQSITDIQENPSETSSEGVPAEDEHEVAADTENMQETKRGGEADVASPPEASSASSSGGGAASSQEDAEEMTTPKPAPPEPSAAEDPPEEKLVSGDAAAQTAQSLTTLMSALHQANAAKNQASSSGDGLGGLTVVDLVRELMRPMVKEWLEGNLPAMVEKTVETEIKRIIQETKL